MLLLLSVTSACSRGNTPDAADPVTFSRSIAPIVFSRCAPCHRPGGAAPFSLLTYADVHRRARQIADVTVDRIMPPWMPEPGHGEFQGERRLTDAQIAAIARWVEQGAPEGSRDDLPPTPTWPAGWELGQPDLVATVPEPLTVPAEGADLFRTIVVPVAAGGVRYVRAVEFRPGNPRAVHHAVIRLVRSASARARVIESEGMLATEEDIASPDGHLVGWAPGYSPNVSPPGMAWRLEPGTSLAIELHLNATGKPERVGPSVGLFFTADAPTRTPFGLQLGSYAIDIPAGARDYTVEDRYELPVDVELHAIYPHAHYLGKELRAWAMRPDGREIPLILIRDWDFNWQNAYRYQRPVPLPRGTILRMRYTYDNSADNPRNPSDPPRRVRYGGSSRDEMGNLWIQVVPASAADLTTLRADYDEKALARRIEGFEGLAAERPRDPAVRRALGAAYLRLGRVPDAVRTLNEAIALDGRDAAAHYNLGHALAASDRHDEALRAFGEAARLQPGFAEAHNNIGVLLRQAGRLVEAERAFRAAVAAAPSYAPAHNNLGTTLRARRDLRGALAALQEAVRLEPQFADAQYNLGVAHQEAGDRVAATRHLRRALQLAPAEAPAYNALAWLLATAPDRTFSAIEEAGALADRAVRLTGGRDASSLETLAVVLAARGDYPRASAAAERALQLARSSGQTVLASSIERRLSEYRKAAGAARR